MDITFIQRRRQEVTEELSRLGKRKAEMEQELRDLDVTVRTLERLAGAKWPKASLPDTAEPPKASGGKPKGIPTTPAMIAEALEGMDIVGGMEPKDIRDWIAERYWPDVSGDSIASVAWRMWKEGRLSKENSRYMLPEKNETADEDPTKETSAASLFQPRAQGREAGPRRGT